MEGRGKQAYQKNKIKEWSGVYAHVVDKQRRERRRKGEKEKERRRRRGRWECGCTTRGMMIDMHGLGDMIICG